MQVEIRLNNSWVDVSNYVVGAITIDRRVDEVLDSGAFTFVSKDIDYNIPPLTICIVDGEIWLCSSECNEVIPSNPKEYNHNVTLIELTYYLQCYIVGTKAMSNTGTMYPTNKDKCEALVDFINNKYSLIFGDKANQFKFDTNAFNDSRWKLEREFMFGSGTTLFQALLEIGKTCNAIPRLTNTTITSNETLDLTVDWDLLDYNNRFTIDENKVLTRQYNQNVDEYTAILESEVYDVVDRSTTTRVINLSVRSESYVISADNQVLILPSKIEKITKLTTSGVAIGKKTVTGFSLHVDAEKVNEYKGQTKYLMDFKDMFTDETYYNAVCYMLTGVSAPGATRATLSITGSTFTLADSPQIEYEVKNIDISKQVLEKTQYDLLTAQEKPKYCYYIHNDNKIYGMYEFYADDWWGHSLNIAVSPFLSYALSGVLLDETVQEDDRYGTTVVSYISFVGFKDYNPMNYVFNVEYTPITSTYLLSNNDKKPFNEEINKLVSRSFQLSDSMSDFDLLVDSIDKNNNMMGLPEVSISYYGNNYPKPRDLIRIKDEAYYVSSVQTTILLGQYTSVINLVKEYNKIAEVFGVKTQYESTRLPLNNIIDRIVYCGYFDRSLKYNAIHITGSNFDLIKQGVYLEKGKNRYFVVEATDNYCFDKQNYKNNDLKDGYTENKDIPYANDNNEQVEYTVSLCNVKSNLSLDLSKKMPEYDVNMISLSFDGSHKIKLYKDARERLIFVCKLDSNEIDDTPQTKFTVTFNYDTKLVSPHGVRIIGYDIFNVESSQSLNNEVKSITMKNINAFKVAIMGAGHKVNVGYTLGGHDIISAKYPNDLEAITINKNSNIYIEEIDTDTPVLDLYSFRINYINEVVESSSYGVAVIYTNSNNETESVILNNDNDFVKLNNIASLTLQIAGPSSITYMNVGGKSNKVAVAKKVYKYSFTMVNLQTYDNGEIYITEID